jgi:hypothetical protein
MPLKLPGQETYCTGKQNFNLFLHVCKLSDLKRYEANSG